MEERPKELSQRPINTFERIVFLCLIIALVALSASAQTQQGYVKTPGRRVNGQTIPGKRLSGVTVQIKGRNAVVSKDDGTFSFPVPDSKFSIQSVKKQGYTLVDPDATAIQYVYSANPLILVMETPKKLKDDKLAVEQNLNKNLQEEFNNKYGELESLLDQNIITKEEYQAAWWKLQDEFTSKQSEIDYMAYYFSRIDYDQLDEFNQNFSDFILNGRLSEAYDLWCSRDDSHTSVTSHLYADVTSPNSKQRTSTEREGAAANRSAKMYDVTFLCNVEDVPVLISIDGKPAGDINQIYKLSKGNHKVLITADGYEPLNSSIEVVEEGNFFYFKLKKTRVEVDSIESHN